MGDSKIYFAYNYVTLWAGRSLETNLERGRKSLTKKEEKVTLGTRIMGSSTAWD